MASPKKTIRSFTPKKAAGIVASALVRWLCRHNRSWKHPLYGEVLGGTSEFVRKAKK